MSGLRTSCLCSVVVVLLLVLAACGYRSAAQSLEPEFDPAEITEYAHLKMSFTGDLMAHRPTFVMPDFQAIYAGLEGALLEDDITFVNLETPADATRPYETYPTFNVHPEFVRAALDAGADVLSLANNHTNDQGAGGIRQTMATMRLLEAEMAERQRSLWYSGIRLEGEPTWEMTRISQGGWEIGFIAITDFMNSNLARALVYLVDYTDPAVQQDFLNFLANEKKTGAYDFIIVSFHGGWEYVTTPPKYIADFLTRVSQAGADIVWGNHPHVMQPWRVEYLPTGRAGKIVIHSLGNFISGQTWYLTAGDWNTDRAYTGDSAILRIEARKNLRTGAVDFSIPDPLWVSTFTFDGGTRIGKLEKLANNAPGGWATYYTRRLEAMRRLTAGLDLLRPEVVSAGFSAGFGAPVAQLFP